MATLKRNGADNSRQESTAGTTKVHVKMLEGARGGGGGSSLVSSIISCSCLIQGKGQVQFGFRL